MQTVDYAQQVEELSRSAAGLDRGPTMIAVREEAVRIADAHNDEELGFETRLELIQAATFGGAPDVAMVAFAWCLGQVDRQPQRFFISQLLWKYKWMLTAAAKYPTIQRQQIADMLTDMTRRYRADGSGMHPVHQTARTIYRIMGDMEAAKAAHRKVLRSERSHLSNCLACEQNAQMNFYFDIGQNARALEKARPLVEGRMSCAEVPHATYASLLLPLWFAGKAETAAEYFRKSVRMIGTNPSFLVSAADQVLYLTVSNNLPVAAKCLQKHLGNGLSASCPSWRFHFDRAATLLFDCLAEQPRPPRVRLPANVQLPGADPGDPASMRDHFAAEARTLATAFDTRNGNEHYTRQLAELADLKKRVVAH